MTIIRRKTPLGELASLRRVMDRVSQDSFARTGSECSGDEHQLALDIRTSGDEGERDDGDGGGAAAERGA